MRAVAQVNAKNAAVRALKGCRDGLFGSVVVAVRRPDDHAAVDREGFTFDVGGDTDAGLLAP
jgi:hypothetical protein